MRQSYQNRRLDVRVLATRSSNILLGQSSYSARTAADRFCRHALSLDRLSLRQPRHASLSISDSP